MWHHSKGKRLIVPQRKSTEELFKTYSRSKNMIPRVPKKCQHYPLPFNKWSSVMYLPEALGCTVTVTLRSDTLSKDEEATNSEVEEGECTHTAAKERDKSYYTESIRTSKLHDLLSSHHRDNGEGILMSIDDILKIEGQEGSLRGPSPSLQYLLDCIVLSEEKYLSCIPYEF